MIYRSVYAPCACDLPRAMGTRLAMDQYDGLIVADQKRTILREIGQRLGGQSDNLSLEIRQSIIHLYKKNRFVYEPTSALHGCEAASEIVSRQSSVSILASENCTVRHPFNHADDALLTMSRLATRKKYLESLADFEALASELFRYSSMVQIVDQAFGKHFGAKKNMADEEFFPQDSAAVTMRTIIGFIREYSATSNYIEIFTTYNQDEKARVERRIEMFKKIVEDETGLRLAIYIKEPKDHEERKFEHDRFVITNQFNTEWTSSLDFLRSDGSFERLPVVEFIEDSRASRVMAHIRKVQPQEPISG